jgi:hypothetical protein
MVIFNSYVTLPEGINIRGMAKGGKRIDEVSPIGPIG